ncbi:MAG: efflux RND transporter periplasmic adaptor subunit, partial [Planctomycetales bacterium]|nr:efflux RND transporter periplasmic adaptor subunit [Planctomycetales bacterium]
GFSQPLRQASLSGATYGIMMSRDVREGEWVHTGDCLVQIDHRVHDERLRLARVASESIGELQVAEAELAASQSRHSRLVELAQRKHATEVELLQAKEELEIARGNVQRAKDRMAQQQAEYARLLAESEQYRVKAPFDGVIVEFHKEVGEYVGPGESIVCTLADTSVLSVEFLVPRVHLASTVLGEEVDVVFTSAKRTVSGKVTYISPFPNGETNTYKVKVRVDNADGQLSAGERCLLESQSLSSPTGKDSSGK